jgi:peroxiredoxin
VSGLAAGAPALAIALLAGVLAAPPDKIAPDFSLPSVNGAAVRLTDFRGKVVLLNFWATWCAPCRIEMPWLVEVADHFKADGLVVIGVSMDSGGRGDILKVIAERGVTYPILIGTNDVADAYGGVRFLPQTFFIGRDGRILRQAFGITSRQDLFDVIQAVLERSKSAD